MAIQSIRVDDLTGDPGAALIVVVIGRRAWQVDLVDPSVKQLEEAIRPWTDAGTEISGGLAAAAKMMEPMEPKDSEPLADDEPAGVVVEADPLAMTATDRAHCRAWAQSVAQKVLNQYDIASRPAARGSLSPKVTRAWVAEGRPGAGVSG